MRAAQSVLLELWTLLGEFRESMTVVGGSAPPLLIASPQDDPYVGTTDVDLVIDPLTVADDVYRTIGELLRERGYRQDPQQPFRWYRFVHVDREPVEVEVDLLAPATPQTGKARRNERIGGEPLARRTDGAELLRTAYVEKTLEGILPDGRGNRVGVRVARAAALLVLKALALTGRDKPKDAYDIDYLLAYAPEGVKGISADLVALKDVPVVKKAIDILRDKYRDIDSNGPQSVAAYRRYPLGSTEADQCQALAYGRVADLLAAIA